MADIKQGKNKFFIGENEDNIQAEIHYIQSGNHHIIVNHTYVSEDLRGSGVGKKLVEKIVYLAREAGKKIIPVCPYVENQLQKNERWHDVLN